MSKISKTKEHVEAVPNDKAFQILKEELEKANKRFDKNEKLNKKMMERYQDFFDKINNETAKNEVGLLQ